MHRLIFNILILIAFFSNLRSDNKQDLALNHFMQGQFLLNQGNYALAVIEFQDALILDPNATTIHISIADAYRRLGKEKRSREHLTIALELDPEDIEAMRMLGQSFIGEKNFIEAEKVFIKLNKLDPENLDYLYVLADLAKIKKSWNAAIDYYIEVYKINSNAINSLEQALQISLSTNNLDKSDEICELMLINNPENIDLLETQKDIAIFNKNFDKALNIILIIEEKKGLSKEIFIQKSALYEQLNQHQSALKIMYDAFEFDSLNIDILQRLVSLLLDQNLNEEALLYNKRIIDFFPDDSKGFINYAVMALSGKKPEDAIASLKNISNRFLDDFMVQYLLGTSYYQVKDYDNAEIYLSNALKIFPESRNTKHNLALIYDIKKEWVKSDKLYLNLIASDSTDAQAFNNYAYSLIERNKDIEFALELSKTAIRISPKSAPYLDTIGWIYFKMNQYDKALDYIKESLSIDKNNPTIKEHLDEVIKAKAEMNYPINQQVEKN